MKTSKQLSFFLGFVFITCYSIAQGTIAPALSKQFPPGIVRKIYETTVSKINLSEQQQLWLAKAYLKQDSLIAATIINDPAAFYTITRMADSTQWLIEDGLKAILSAKEKAEYESLIENKRDVPAPVYEGKVYMNAEMNSQFGLAFKSRAMLHLTDSQCIAILAAANDLKLKTQFSNNHPDSGFFDKPAFESDYLSKILTERQYNDMLANKNAENCKLLARYVWHDLVLAGFANKFNKDTTLNRVAIYYMLREHIVERMANEKERRAMMLGAIPLPDALKALQESKMGNKQKLDKYSW